MIYIGTCGYSYADWKGEFYPATIRPDEMLAFYARTFGAVELDGTYYRVPSLAAFAGMAARAPAGFRFCVKLPAGATHVMDVPDKVHPDVALLRRNMQPLVERGMLAAALMQFPNSFRPGAGAYARIAALRAALDDVTLVAEFRHHTWQTHATLEYLRGLAIGWVNVDMPALDTLMRPSADVTTPVAYVRFHGRNAGQWWQGDNITRYDYEYIAAELGPWADRLIDLAANPEVREVLGFFNNHRRGQAARNAKLFDAMLRTRFPAAVVRLANAPPVEQLGFDLGS